MFDINYHYDFQVVYKSRDHKTIEINKTLDRPDPFTYLIDFLSDKGNLEDWEVFLLSTNGYDDHMIVA